MRALGSVGLVVLLVLAAATFWFDAQFEEPSARRIDSLAAELGAATWLCVFAHPDDEVTVAGALEDAAKRGVRIHVITATRGENGRSDLPVSGPEELGRVREAELREHTRVLGVAEQIVWSYTDGGVTDRIDEVAGRIAREIERIRPEAVLTFHPESGITFHADHRAVGEATVQALAKTGGDLRLVHPIAPRRVMGRFAGSRGVSVAEGQPPATHTMPIEAATKVRGWQIHASQAKYMRRVWKVPPRVLHFFYDAEHYWVRGS